MITEKATNTAVGGKGKSVTHSVSSQRVTPIDVTSQPTDENNSGTDFETLDNDIIDFTDTNPFGMP